MRLISGIILFLILTGYDISWANSDYGGKQFSVPSAEYSVVIIDTSSPGLIKAKLFFALSMENGKPEKETFIFRDLKKGLITSVEVNDYLFFKARYINPLEKRFHDNYLANLNIEELQQKLEIISVILFQQPFWSIHLAFKLPTALLEWQLSMKNMQTGQDQWVGIVSSNEKNIPDEFDSNFDYETESPLSVSYFLPGKTDRNTTRGLMLSYSETCSGTDQLIEIVEQLSNIVIVHMDSQQELHFPVIRIFVVNKDRNSGVFLKPEINAKMDEITLINRINAKENGLFVTSEGIVTTESSFGSNIVIQKYSHYIDSPLESSPFSVIYANSPDDYPDFKQEISNPKRMNYYTGIARILISGLVIWVFAFWLFFRSVVNRLNKTEFLGLALLSYLSYTMTSLVFSFMLAFGFFLGLILMTSIVGRYAKEVKSIKLFIYSLMTSFSTALVVFLLGKSLYL